jgi:hypothetical protein
MYQVGPNIPLCLSCYTQWQQINFRNIEITREEMNHIDDEIYNMFGVSNGKYPTKQPVFVSKPITNNHIIIKENQIGILNTGHINNINQNIDNLIGNSASDLANKIKDFIQTVVDETSFSNEQKNEILENLEFISSELLQTKEKRKTSIIYTLLSKTNSIVNTSASIYTLWQALEILVNKFISV